MYTYSTFCKFQYNLRQNWGPEKKNGFHYPSFHAESDCDNNSHQGKTAIYPLHFCDSLKISNVL